MAYRLLIGQRSYSSWSLRGYLCFALFDIPVTLEEAVIYSPDFAAQVRAFGGGSSVPAVATENGVILRDSLSIAWHLSEAFPRHGLLPRDGAARAEAQNLIAEMHAGFGALCSACPMNLRTAWVDFFPSDAVMADLARLEARLGAALEKSGGPFLFGAPTVADAFYAPVAIRIVGYGLPVSARLRAYVNAILAVPVIQEWRETGLAQDEEVSVYDMAPLERRPFPQQI